LDRGILAALAAAALFGLSTPIAKMLYSLPGSFIWVQASA
jgi:hypothetical protein